MKPIFISLLALCLPLMGADKDKENFESDKALALKGDRVGQYNLGWAYRHGRGVEKDLKEAVKWYRKAAEQGNSSAQYNLGWAYKNGEGVEKDLKEAAKWYQKAADQGLAKAQFYLAYMIHTNWAASGGENEKDIKEVAKGYQKAAEQGYARAQYNLGWLYEFGQGVEKDLKEAAKWYQKADEQAFAQAKEKVKALKEYLPVKTLPVKTTVSAGKILWIYPTVGQVKNSPAVGPDGTVYFGTMNKKFYALDGKNIRTTFKNGKKNTQPSKKWSIDVDSGVHVASATIGQDGSVFFCTMKGWTYCVDGATGKIK